MNIKKSFMQIKLSNWTDVQVKALQAQGTVRYCPFELIFFIESGWYYFDSRKELDLL